MTTKPEIEHLYLDDLDEEPLETVYQEGIITLCDLARLLDTAAGERKPKNDLFPK